jgi:chromatin segregation and condensation protein Rec8/ScpA/Scc1 (kleisin family)
MQPIEIARTFIAMLYLGMSDMLDIEQREEVDDIKMILKNK